MHSAIVIALDVDDVLIDLVPAWLKRYTDASGHQLEKHHISDWAIHSFMPAEWKDAFYRLRTPELYRSLQPVAGAQQGVKELEALGATLVAVTNDTQPYLYEKSRAIWRFFPQIKEIVLAKQKRVVRYDYLVDDGIHNFPSILFSQPWNEYFQIDERWQRRANGWGEVKDKIIEAEISRGVWL